MSLVISECAPLLTLEVFVRDPLVFLSLCCYTSVCEESMAITQQLFCVWKIVKFQLAEVLA